jgi:hypothetical protein
VGVGEVVRRSRVKGLGRSLRLRLAASAVGSRVAEVGVREPSSLGELLLVRFDRMGEMGMEFRAEFGSVQRKGWPLYPS